MRWKSRRNYKMHLKFNEIPLRICPKSNAFLPLSVLCSLSRSYGNYKATFKQVLICGREVEKRTESQKELEVVKSAPRSTLQYLFVCGRNLQQTSKRASRNKRERERVSER